MRAAIKLISNGAELSCDVIEIDDEMDVRITEFVRKMDNLATGDVITITEIDDS